MNRKQRVAKLRGIYAILNGDAPDALGAARNALNAGVRVLQFRAKRALVVEDVRAVCRLAHAQNALLLLNDDWQAALALDCDGVHLGPDDIAFADLASVRELFDERIIGVSCGTVAEVRQIDSASVDYFGVGAVFPTNSKADAGAPIGLTGLRRIVAATALPVAAIGGIDRSNLGDVRATGVAMAAVISAIASAPNQFDAAQKLVQMWEA